MIIDAVVGKAKRKLFASILDHLTGVETWSDDTAIETAAEAGPSAPAAEAVQPPKPDEQEKLKADYTYHAAQCKTIKEVNEVAKSVGMDGKLTPQSMGELHKVCDQRRKEIRDGRGEGGNGNK